MVSEERMVPKEPKATFSNANSFYFGLFSLNVNYSYWQQEAL